MSKNKSLGALSLVTALILSVSLPMEALADVKDAGKKVLCDETYYVNLDYYGNVKDASIVKSYTLNGHDKITDFGDYEELRSLSGDIEPSYDGSAYSFGFPENDIPKHFYLEGKTEKPYDTLPWNISVRYALNGVISDVEEIAGKTGTVDIMVDIIPNKKASSYTKNNYTLATAALFNQDDISFLEAKGAQIQMVGNIKAVLFIALPGETQHLDIKVGTDCFEFGGLTFTMFPITLSQASDLQKLSKDKDKLEDNYHKISDRLDEVLDEFDDINDDLLDTADDLDRLNGDSKKISGSVRPLTKDIESMRSMVRESLDTLSPMMKNMVSLKVDLQRLKECIERIKTNNETLEDLLKDLSSVRSSLVETRDALEKAEDYYYTFPDPEALASAPLPLPTELIAMMYPQTAPESLPVTVPLADGLYFLYKIKSTTPPPEGTKGVPFKTFVVSFLMSNGRDRTTAEELAKICNLKISEDKSASLTDPDRLGINTENTFDQTDLIITIATDFEDSIGAMLDDVLGAPEELLDDLQDLIGDVRSYRYMIDDVNDVLDVADSAIVEKGDMILSDIDSLDEIINRYRPEAGKTADDIIKAAEAAADTSDDAGILMGDLADLIRKTTDRITSNHVIRNTKEDVDEIISDTWNDFTGDKNNALNIDTEAPIQSLTDKRNPSPESVQTVIRTAEIKVPDSDGPEKETSKAVPSVKDPSAKGGGEKPKVTFADRVKNMLNDIASFVKSLFGGKNA